MLKNLFLNTSAIRYAPDAEGNKTAAELEREAIEVEELKPKKEGEEGDGKSDSDDKTDSENDGEEGEQNTEGEGESKEEDEEEVTETAEEKAIREADEAANADKKTKRQIERMQTRIDKLTAQKTTSDTEKAELKKLLDAKKEDGTLTLTEEEVERRAELKANEKLLVKQFNNAVNTLAREAKALDKDFNANIKTVTDEIGLLPPVMIGILEDLVSEATDKKAGAEVLVYLSKNVDEYEDIHQLTEGRMALALQKIANKITKKPAKPISRVPEPNAPINTGRVQGSLNDKMSDADWIAKREADLAAKRRTA